MPASIREDSVKILKMTKRHGVVQTLVRQFIVEGLTDDDYEVLESALAVAGVPAHGTSLGGSFAANLILVTHDVSLLEEDPGTVEVTLTYEIGKQSINAPAFGFLLGEVTASIQQTTTNKDIDGSQITVSHTYPANDEHFPNQTKTQGGQIEYFEPQTSMRFSGIKLTRYPWLLARKLVGSINQRPWFGAGEHEWMCVSATWKPLNQQDNVSYEMSFEFQHRLDTWDSTAVFIDENTGRPPENLIDGTGIKTIRKHAEVDFEDVIGARMQGG